ncbi:kinase-like domain-containing protein [Dunaliella salina]|uniref:Kinase-like domain-containing protein n=1 Tax=Dunaliella salina TaxID=3046 RepID=A0ABZ3KD33_DUNSA|nr:kinase-like domain-containing protein [Dunaliella salina]|eukprot:KAF5827081.1 kinase-like domain-containing protein [Dunaliella salina]
MAQRDFIPADQVKRGDVISSGGFGLVYEGRLLEKRSGRWLEVALKQLKPEVERVERDLKQFDRELQETLEIARWCKHVVKCFGWTRVGFRQSPALVMKMYKQTLQELILKDDARNLRDTDDPADRLAPALMLRIAKDVAHGLAELHNARISNEDLKPGNVLLDAENHAVLTDFGISKFFGSGSQETVQFSTLHIRGTSPFLPPEKLASDNARMTYSLAVDMWAFGILLGQMVTVDLLYPYGHGVTWVNVRNQLVRDRRAPTPPAVPELPRLQQLIHDCLQLDPAQRITAEQAIHVRG